MPVKFHFVEKSSRELEGLKIVEHESEVSYLLLKPNGKTNNSFKASSMLKNIDKIFEN